MSFSSSSEEASTAAPVGPSRLKSTLLKLAFSVALLLVLFELACQLILWRAGRQWDALKREPGHYFRASANPTLVYELRPGFDYVIEGRRLHINQFGVRDDAEIVPSAPRRVAILGDSVVFGIEQSQDQTISALLQKQLDPSRQNIAVINVGVPGYSLREMPALLNDKDAIYHFSDVVYVMNPNDFSWRDCVYEGADNGVYRLYRRPALASPFLIRKAIYRYHKSQQLTTTNEVLDSVPWYQWMFAGNRDRALERVREMKRYADERHINFTMVLLPAGCAYKDGQYQLSAMYDQVDAFLKRSKIPALDPRQEFVGHVSEWVNGTDHLTLEGNRAMANYLAAHLSIAPATAPTTSTASQ
jgi:hypothetical protein